MLDEKTIYQIFRLRQSIDRLSKRLQKEPELLEKYNEAMEGDTDFSEISCLQAALANLEEILEKY